MTHNTCIIFVAVKESGGDLYLSEEQHWRSTAACFSWHVMHSLHSPNIHVTRKGYLQMLHQARQLGIHIPLTDWQADVKFDQL